MSRLLILCILVLAVASATIGLGEVANESRFVSRSAYDYVVASGRNFVFRVGIPSREVPVSNCCVNSRCYLRSRSDHTRYCSPGCVSR